MSKHHQPPGSIYVNSQCSNLTSKLETLETDLNRVEMELKEKGDNWKEAVKAENEATETRKEVESVYQAAADKAANLSSSHRKAVLDFRKYGCRRSIVTGGKRTKKARRKTRR
jgi:chromosome segregation ATPase